MTTSEHDDHNLDPAEVRQQDSLSNYITGQPNQHEVRRWTLQQAYLAQYAETGRVYESAAIAGCSAVAIEFWHRKDSFGFQNRYAEAKQRFLEQCEAEIDRRAFQGVEKKYFNAKGELTGSTTQWSDNLAMFRVKKLDPSYRENAQLVDGLVEVVSVLDELRRIGTPRVTPALPAGEAEVDNGETA